MRRHEQARLFLRKATQDEALLDEVGNSANVCDEVFGFHCQKAAEKLLKALVSAAGGTFSKTHGLAVLAASLAETGVLLPVEFDALDALTPFGSVYRYEDLDSLSRFDRSAARALLRSLHSWCEQRLESLRAG